MRVLPPCRVRREEGAERVSISRRRVLPIGANGIPAVAEPVLIGITVLGNDCSDAIRVSNSDAETNRRTLVEDIDREMTEADYLGEAID